MVSLLTRIRKALNIRPLWFVYWSAFFSPTQSPLRRRYRKTNPIGYIFRLWFYFISNQNKQRLRYKAYLSRGKFGRASRYLEMPSKRKFYSHKCHFPKLKTSILHIPNPQASVLQDRILQSFEIEAFLNSSPTDFNNFSDDNKKYIIFYSHEKASLFAESIADWDIPDNVELVFKRKMAWFNKLDDRRRSRISLFPSNYIESKYGVYNLGVAASKYLVLDRSYRLLINGMDFNLSRERPIGYHIKGLSRHAYNNDEFLSDCLQHDPAINFNIISELYYSGLIDLDERCKTLVEQGVHKYFSLLEEKFREYG